MDQKGAGPNVAKRVLLECTLVMVCGLSIGLIANGISPRGIKLSRNYFPKESLGTIDTNTALNRNVLSGGTNELVRGTTNSVAQRLARRGISVVDSNYVIAAFNSPERAQHLLIFIDARDDAHYKQGHIPGSYQLDYYRPEGYLPTVLPAASIAQKIVIYCNGGDCEDSEFAATLLNDAGVVPQKIFVYGGGFIEWSTNKLPVELNSKDSQQFR